MPQDQRNLSGLGVLLTITCVLGCLYSFYLSFTFGTTWGRDNVAAFLGGGIGLLMLYVILRFLRRDEELPMEVVTCCILLTNIIPFWVVYLVLAFPVA